MTVLLLSGSLGRQSYTRTLLKLLEKLLKQQNIKVVFWDLSSKPLPIAVPEYHNRPYDNPSKSVRAFNKAISKADGLILGSPLYHGSFTGVLKNALDNLPANSFISKPVALTSHSSNARSCVRPCYELRPIVNSLGGYCTNIQIGTTDTDFQRSAKTTKVVEMKILNRSESLINELLELMRLLKN